MKSVCVFLLQVLLVKSEWEIPDELLPPKILAEIVGGFSPFVGYFSALGSSTNEWLQSYAQNSDPTLFTYIMQPSTQPFTRTNIGMEEGPACELQLRSNSDLRLTFPDEHGKCVQSNVLTNVKLNVNLTTFCWMLCSDVAERCFSNRNSSQQLCICENCQEIKPENSFDDCNPITDLTIQVFRNETLTKELIRTSRVNMTTFGDNCTIIRSTNIQFLNYEPNPTVPRFWLQRGRFQCPSEVTCPLEMLYIFTSNYHQLIEKIILAVIIGLIFIYYTLIVNTKFVYNLQSLYIKV